MRNLVIISSFDQFNYGKFSRVGQIFYVRFLFVSEDHEVFHLAIQNFVTRFLRFGTGGEGNGKECLANFANWSTDSFSAIPTWSRVKVNLTWMEFQSTLGVVSITFRLND